MEPICANGSEMQAKSIQEPPNRAFHAHLGCYLRTLGHHLGSCWPSLAPSCRQLVAKCCSDGPTYLHKDRICITIACQDPLKPLKTFKNFRCFYVFRYGTYLRKWLQNSCQIVPRAASSNHFGTYLGALGRHLAANLS